MNPRIAIVLLVLLALAAVGVVGAVYVTGHRLPSEEQDHVKQYAVAALALLGFLFTVVFVRGFVRAPRAAGILIVLTLLVLGGGAAFMWMKLSPPPPRSTTVPPVAAPASKSRLVVRSEPAGAGVFIDGTRFATTPASLILPNGKYEVTVRMDGYADWAETVTLSEERTLEVNLQSR